MAEAVDEDVATGGAAASSADAGASSADAELAAVDAKLADQERLLREWRARDAAESGGAIEDVLAEARRKRDAARKSVQSLQQRLSSLLANRRDKADKLDKLNLKKKAQKNAVVNPEQALPSVVLRGGGDAELVREIEQLMRENKELEESLAQHEGTRLHLEKLQNEKRDTARKIKELKGEEKLLLEQLEIKKAELAELHEQVKPSPVRARYEADVARLRKEVAAHTASRTHAEREAAAHSKRLLRVRAVLGAFLKTEGIKPQQPLPVADDELATRLAEHVIALNGKVRGLERTVSAREEKAAELQRESDKAAEDLKRLVARRGKEQRKVTGAGLLTDGPAGSADGAGGSADAVDGAADDTTPANAPEADAPSARRGPARAAGKRLAVKNAGGRGKAAKAKGSKAPAPPLDVVDAEGGAPTMPNWDDDGVAAAPPTEG